LDLDLDALLSNGSLNVMRFVCLLLLIELFFGILDETLLVALFFGEGYTLTATFATRIPWITIHFTEGLSSALSV
jgi:hypothetical protein